MRFLAVNADAYEPMRAEVDAASGFPDADTETMWNPATVAPVAADGRLLLALPDAIATLGVVAAAIGARLDTGECVEISEAEYRAMLPPEPPIG